MSKKCEMFIIRREYLYDSNSTVYDSRFENYVYCPVKELRHIIKENSENTDDYCKIFRGILIAYRASDNSVVDAKEIFE